MTTNIDPLQPAGHAPPAAPPPAASSFAGDFVARLGQARDAQAPTADTAAGDGPPPELAAEMAAASRTWDSLAASGRELHFQESGGHVQVSMHSLAGERIAVLQLSDLYALIEHEGAA